jgi:hypothetical protein
MIILKEPEETRKSNCETKQKENREAVDDLYSNVNESIECGRVVIHVQVSAVNSFESFDKEFTLELYESLKHLPSIPSTFGGDHL